MITTSSDGSEIYAYRALAGCGHYPMLEVPDAFTAALRAELAGLRV